MSRTEPPPETVKLAEQLGDQLADEQLALQRRVPTGERDAAIMRAQIAYLTDHAGRPAEYFYPLVADVISKQDYLRLTIERMWVRQREKMFAIAQQTLLARLTDHLITERMRELEELTTLRHDLLDLAMPMRTEIIQDGEVVKVRRDWKVEPKSLEGVIRAFRDITVLLDETRNALHAVVGQAVPRLDAKSDTEDGPLEYEEAVEAVRQVLELKIRQQHEG